MRLDELPAEVQTRVDVAVQTRDRIHNLLSAVLTVGSNPDLQSVREFTVLGIAGSSGPMPARRRSASRLA